MTEYIITNAGWYLISGMAGHSIDDLIHSEVTSAVYAKYAFLKIKYVYFPLLDGYDPSGVKDGNGIVIFSPTELEYNLNVGETENAASFTAAANLGTIQDLSGSLSVNIGLWVKMETTPITPTLSLEITNDNVYSIVTETGVSTYPTIYSYSDGSGTPTYDASNLFFESSGNMTISLKIQRTFTFGTSMIIPTITGNEPYLEFYDASQQSNYISNTISDGSGNFLTDAIDASAQIIYTIVNAGDSDKSFAITVNLSVKDTVPPLMRFYHDESTDGTSAAYTITTDSSGGILDDDNDGCFRGEGNEVTIKLGQSYIQGDSSANFLPKVGWYDQNDVGNEDASGITIVKHASKITDDPGSYDASMIDLSYNAGEWRPGTYRLTYSCTDDNSINTTVDASFIIVDDIYPTLIISDVSDNVSAYTSAKREREISTDISNNTYERVGITLSNLFTTAEATSSSTISKHLYIKYTDMESSSWYFPEITTKSDYAGGTSDVLDLSDNNVNITDVSSGGITIDDDSQITITGDFVPLNSDNFIDSTTESDNSFIRTYSLTDAGNLTVTIILYIKIIDDTIPTISMVTVTPVKYKIHYGNDGTPDDAKYTALLDTSYNIFDASGPVTDVSKEICRYDNISFEITTDRDCKAQIDIYHDGSSTSIEITSGYDNNSTIELDHDHTLNIGEHILIISVWDQNDNVYSFKYTINIVAIPTYSLLMYYLSGTEPLSDTSFAVGDDYYSVYLRIDADAEGYKQFMGSLTIRINAFLSTDLPVKSSDNHFGYVNYETVSVYGTGKILFRPTSQYWTNSSGNLPIDVADGPDVDDLNGGSDDDWYTNSTPPTKADSQNTGRFYRLIDLTYYDDYIYAFDTAYQDATLFHVSEWGVGEKNEKYFSLTHATADVNMDNVYDGSSVVKLYDI